MKTRLKRSKHNQTKKAQTPKMTKILSLLPMMQLTQNTVITALKKLTRTRTQAKPRSSLTNNQIITSTTVKMVSKLKMKRRI